MSKVVHDPGEAPDPERTPAAPQAPAGPARKRAPTRAQRQSAAAKLLAVSGAPAVVRVALARHGTHEDSTRAPLPTNYPYPARMRRSEYEALKQGLQIELLKVQKWVKETGQRMLTLFEGRDAAGKGGTIKRFTEHLNPRQSARRARGCPRQALRGRARPVVLPALHPALSHARRDGVLRPLLVQPRRRRARDGVLHAAGADAPLHLAPWVVIKSDDKKRARINCIRHFLSVLDYPDRDAALACAPDPLLVGSAAKVIEEAERVLPRIEKQLLEARREAKL